MPKNTTSKETTKKPRSIKPLLPQKGSPMDTFNRALQKIVSVPKKSLKKK